MVIGARRHGSLTIRSICNDAFAGNVQGRCLEIISWNKCGNKSMEPFTKTKCGTNTGRILQGTVPMTGFNKYKKVFLYSNTPNIDQFCATEWPCSKRASEIVLVINTKRACDKL
jgi:hypothetical protein